MREYNVAVFAFQGRAYKRSQLTNRAGDKLISTNYYDLRGHCPFGHDCDSDSHSQQTIWPLEGLVLEHAIAQTLELLGFVGECTVSAETPKVDSLSSFALIS